MAIRRAERRDLATIGAILNAEIADGTASWKSEPLDTAALGRWFDDRMAAGTILVEDRGSVVGVAAAGPFRTGEGYARTIEHSVYVARDARGRGIGTALLSALIDWACDAGHHRMVGGVSADQPASLALHARLGFVECGRLPEVGRKEGRWLDLVLMVRALE